MKFKFLLLGVFISINVFGQRDTIIYYSEQGCPIPTIDNAVSYETLVNVFNGQFTLTQFNKLDNKWQKSPSTSISKLSDSSFSMISYGRTIRFFQKIDSGYIIKDYKNSILTKVGFSKLIFPLIPYGNWIYFNDSGKKEREYNIINGQIVSSKLWVDEVCYTDSLAQGVTPPFYKGGDIAMYKFIAENCEYPDEAKESNIQGKVFIRFLISSQGKVIGPVVVNKVDKTLAKESIRVIKLMNGNWIPAKNSSSNIDSYKTVPVNFTLR